MTDPRLGEVTRRVASENIVLKDLGYLKLEIDIIRNSWLQRFVAFSRTSHDMFSTFHFFLATRKSALEYKVGFNPHSFPLMMSRSV